MKFLKKIDKTEIVETMTRAASKCGYKLKKASPTIMIVGAAIGGVTATVLACKATIKAQDIMTEHYAQQMVLTIIILLSLPLWKTKSGANAEEQEAVPAEALTLKQIFRISGVKEVLVTFFCYCSLEQTTSLWASSYLVLNRGIAPETAAGFASLFFVGITVGRALCGFLTLKFDDTQMVRMGQGIIAIGIAAFLLPLGEAVTLAGLLLVGLGCAPIYPSIIHATPGRFGADRSQAIIGVQMASAYIGNCLMPPLFGVIANHTTIAIFPYYLLVILILMGYMHEALQKKTKAAQ